MKRILRAGRLTPEEAAKYKTIHQRVEQELPDLIARHHARLAILDQLQELLKQRHFQDEPPPDGKRSY